MDDLRTRLDALERHIHTLQQQTHAMARQLRWWRHLAGGLLAMALLTWALLSGNTADAQSGRLADELAALRDLLTVLRFDAAANEVRITGANLRLVNGLGATETTNGWGNLIVGYNELRGGGFDDIRTGSHNVVVGQQHNFSQFGGLVVGRFNTVSGPFATASGGIRNIVSGDSAVVSGGDSNEASGFAAVVSGGSVNRATREWSSISGGDSNEASAQGSSVSGGIVNTASGIYATVSGGRNRTAEGEFDWVAGSLFEDE